jgi:hypothetical protein
MISNAPLAKRELLLLAVLFLLEGAIFVMLKAVHMKGERAIEVFILSAPGLAFLCAGITVLLAGAVIIRLYLAHKRSPSHTFHLIVAMNLVTLLLILVAGEMAVRIGSHVYMDGEAFGKIALKPKSWEATRLYYLNLTKRASDDLSYIVYDAHMGWSIGPSRRSTNKLYWSSPDQIRVSHEGNAFTMIEGKTTIALIGDSFTFGEEVRYEESYGYYLNQFLGPEVQVLNFGVPGYGIDQAYLRYEKDAKRWKPKIAIFGLFSHDFLRTLTVYPFLANPQWDLPFSKPRLILADGKPKWLNETPLRPEAIFSKPSIFDLPFLKLDRGYKESNWRHSFYHSSYLYQLFVSSFPRWVAVNPEFSDDAFVSINALILKSFTQNAMQQGAIPVAVYFYGRTELGRASPIPPIVKRALHDAGIGYVDPAPCLLEVNPADRFMRGGHYTSAGNAAVVKCLGPVVQEALRQPAVGQKTGMAESLSLSR